MALEEQDILRILMRARDRISASSWVVVRDTQTAEDIFQNVVVKAMTKEVVFEVEGAVLSWAFVTARRESVDWLRRRGRESTALDDSILGTLESEWLDEDVDVRTEALRDCMRGLPEKSKHLFRLRYVEGHACGEVAEQLGAGLNAIYKRLNRLHQRLRECVNSRIGPRGAES